MTLRFGDHFRCNVLAISRRHRPLSRQANESLIQSHPTIFPTKGEQNASSSHTCAAAAPHLRFRPLGNRMPNRANQLASHGWLGRLIP